MAYDSSFNSPKSLDELINHIEKSIMVSELNKVNANINAYDLLECLKIIRDEIKFIKIKKV